MSIRQRAFNKELNGLLNEPYLVNEILWAFYDPRMAKPSFIQEQQGIPDSRIAISASGRIVVIRNTPDRKNIIKIIDIKMQEVLNEIETSPPASGITISPDGHLIFLSNALNSKVRIFNLTEQRKIDPLNIGSHGIKNVALSADGNFVVVQNVRDEVIVWGMQEKTIVGRLLHKNDPLNFFDQVPVLFSQLFLLNINQIAISADGAFIVLGQGSKLNIFRKEADSNKYGLSASVERTIPSKEKALAISRDGKIITLVNAEREVEVWSYSTATKKFMLLQKSRALCPESPQPVEPNDAAIFINDEYQCVILALMNGIWRADIRFN